MKQLPPQLQQRLRLLSAREVLDGVAASEIVGFADDALGSCIYDDLLLAIIDAHPPTRAQVLRPFIRYCEKHGIQISTKDDARVVLFAYYVQRMADGSLDPIKEFDAFLSEVQTEGALKLKSSLSTYAEEIGILMFTEMKYSYESQNAPLSAAELQKATRLSEETAIQLRDAARRVLDKDDHNLAQMALQRSALPHVS